MKQYYVYKLIDPRTEKPFYIGKGSGNRLNEHEKKYNLDKNNAKCKVILDIHNAGFSVTKEIVKTFNEENAAYQYEAKLIKEIGRNNLTNLTDGGKGAPAWVISDEDKHKDIALAEMLFKYMHHTSAFTENISFTFAGQLFDMPRDKTKKLFKVLKKMLVELITKRGIDWLNSVAIKSNIEFVGLSKIERFR